MDVRIRAVSLSLALQRRLFPWTETGINLHVKILPCILFKFLNVTTITSSTGMKWTKLQISFISLWSYAFIFHCSNVVKDGSNCQTIMLNIFFYSEEDQLNCITAGTIWCPVSPASPTHTSAVWCSPEKPGGDDEMSSMCATLEKNVGQSSKQDGCPSVLPIPPQIKSKH